MRYAIVQEGRVINVIEADPDHLPELPGVELAFLKRVSLICRTCARSTWQQGEAS